MTKEQILEDFENYKSLPIKIKALREKISAMGGTKPVVGDPDDAELGRLHYLLDNIENKYSKILDDLGIEQDIDSNSLNDFIDFAHELFKSID